MWHRKYRYMRLDGSSKISARRDMVADFQSRADIFVFLLSTRAGGLGINLTAADTVSLEHFGLDNYKIQEFCFTQIYTKLLSVLGSINDNL